MPAYIYNGSEKRKNRRNQFVWHSNGQKASNILKKLLPYLLVKLDQAEIAIQFQNTFDTYYGIFGTPKDVVEFREKCYTQCRELKKVEFEPF